MPDKFNTQVNFIDLKSRLDEPEVQMILSLSLFQPTPETIARVIERCRTNDERNLWGIVNEEQVLGVIEYYIRDVNTVYVANFAVKEDYRKQGIGRFIIDALQEKCKLPLELETDDDAIDFYRKCGFEVTPFEKNGIQRWKCRRFKK